MRYKINRLGQFVADGDADSWELFHFIDRYCRMNGLMFLRQRMVITDGSNTLATLKNMFTKVYFRDLVNNKEGFIRDDMDVKRLVNNLLH